MKNLAGNEEADRFIQEELFLAGITPVRAPGGYSTEVPHSIAGQLGVFHFRRMWAYWAAEAPEGVGLPLDVATALHERPYPLVGEGHPETYGQVIRVDGDSGGIDPSNRAQHFDTNGLVILDPDGTEEQDYRRLVEQGAAIQKGLRFARSLDDVTRSVVSSYDIDNQIGLNELARVIRES